MAEYGLPAGTNIQYGGKGFPEWVYDLADYFGVSASTYPDHQEGQRAEAGFAPNPHGLNRGIDWSGPVANMQRLADYLMSVRQYMEQVIWENPQTGQRAGVAGGDDVTHGLYYAQDYSGHRDHVHTRQSQPIPLPGGFVESVIRKPQFTEIEAWVQNTSPRSGVKIDLFLLHTQEGGDGDALALARWMGGNNVSYHYTVSTNDVNNVMVCDVVDTDLASWSVLSANPRSINLCFAGSKAAWTRAQWLSHQNSIDVAAYLAVQDCKKYGIPITVLAPPYSGGRAGITDHNYVTKILGDGTHTDVGPGFPWDVFSAAVAKYSGTAPAPVPPKPTPAPTPAPTPTPGGFLMALSDAEQREMLELLRQQSGYRRVSRSPLRHVGEGESQTVTGFQWNTDGSVHVLLIKLLAELGDPDALSLLQEVASLDTARYPDRAHDRQLAQAILNAVAGVGTVGSAPGTGRTPGLIPAPPAPAAPVVADPVPVVVPSAPPAPTPVEPVYVPDPRPSEGGGIQSQVDSLTADISAVRDLLSTLSSQIRS